MDKNITRVDIESFAGGILVRYWLKGWKEGDPPFSSETLTGTVYQFCQMLDEDEHFTVHMDSAKLGRALRGEITRMDFYRLADAWKVSKFPYGWTATTRPIEIKLFQDKDGGFDIAANIQWCQDHGWIVRQWNERLSIPAGYRAFKGKPQPVRDARMIMFLRKKLPNAQLDFAYDC
jgi:hypothetical protein